MSVFARIMQRLTTWSVKMAQIEKKEVAKIVTNEKDGGAPVQNKKGIVVTRIDDKDSGNECYVTNSEFQDGKTGGTISQNDKVSISCVPSLAKLTAASIAAGRAARLFTDEGDTSMQEQQKRVETGKPAVPKR